MKNIPTPKRVAQIKRKRHIYVLRLFILFFILLLSIFGFGAYFSSYSKITLNNIVVNGTNIINPLDVISKIKNDLSGRYFMLYSKSNTFIYPHKEIYSDLIKSFPRIKNLSVSKRNFNTLVINIQEKEASYLYCGGSVPIISSQLGENCYFINSDGYIFGKAPYFSGNVYFKYYVKIKNESNPIGQITFTTDQFHKLTVFINNISKLGFKPVSLISLENGDYRLNLNHDLNATNPKIIFNKENDLNNILDNLAAAKSKPEFINEINSKYDKLLYIDLRFKNKVLYKFQ